ncbi:HAD family hydrolase [Consotaella salsifontis]|uniref:2-haloacid dehalogenase n=1 Tax=Consotaella salsifontis TaxID=1365950 RepID=A0A1T4MVY0_9HYPH|nr:HAD family phosphatase [Consotaella salsifontis]SJZ71113.1 2-haloacid dehalogenase [Consotaella salsifontis]
MIRHVVFDIGGVLVLWDPEIPFKRLIADDQERRVFLSEICSPLWNAEQDRGRSWEEAEAVLIADYPEKADLIRAYRRYWIEMVPHAFEDTVAVLREVIATGLDVTLLTNWAADTFAEAEKLFPFLGEARGITVSGRIKAIKPSPEIYLHHAETFGLDPAATVFIDDSPKNVEAARKAGWQAIRHENAAQLRIDLRKLGVPIAA